MGPKGTEWVFILMIFGCLNSQAVFKNLRPESCREIRQVKGLWQGEVEQPALIWVSLKSVVQIQFQCFVLVHLLVCFFFALSYPYSQYIAICTPFAALWYMQVLCVLLCCCGCCYDATLIFKLFILETSTQWNTTRIEIILDYGNTETRGINNSCFLGTG